jgi:SAM-dependent methyltransferase
MGTVKTWKNHSGLLIDSVNGFDVVACRACGFTHLLPIPLPADLERMYRDEYYSTEKPDYIAEVREDLDWWNLVYRERYELLEGYLPADRRRIIDVGSGPGYFLSHGRARGWAGLGLEPSADAAAHASAQHVETVQAILSPEATRQLGQFDVVQMSEVLELVPDPGASLRLVRSLLSPGGLLCLVVGNNYNPFQLALRAAYGASPWWVQPPVHINYFNSESAATLVTSCGYEVLHTEANFPIEMFLLMGDNYLGNGPVGRQCHHKRVCFEKNLVAAAMGSVKRQLYEALARCGLGRQALFIARRTADDDGLPV